MSFQLGSWLSDAGSWLGDVGQGALGVAQSVAPYVDLYQQFTHKPSKPSKQQPTQQLAQAPGQISTAPVLIQAPAAAPMNYTPWIVGGLGVAAVVLLVRK